VIIAGTAATKL